MKTKSANTKPAKRRRGSRKKKLDCGLNNNNKSLSRRRTLEF
jgi:hypothetical protein